MKKQLKIMMTVFLFSISAFGIDDSMIEAGLLDQEAALSSFRQTIGTEPRQEAKKVEEKNQAADSSIQKIEAEKAISTLAAS